MAKINGTIDMGFERCELVRKHGDGEWMFRVHRPLQFDEGNTNQVDFTWSALKPCLDEETRYRLSEEIADYHDRPQVPFDKVSDEDIMNHLSGGEGGVWMGFDNVPVIFDFEEKYATIRLRNGENLEGCEISQTEIMRGLLRAVGDNLSVAPATHPLAQIISDLSAETERENAVER